MQSQPRSTWYTLCVRRDGSAAPPGPRCIDELFELVAKDVEAGGVFATILSGHEDDSARHAVPLRLLGGLHRLVLDGRAAALRRWYPSTGGTWDGERAWPEMCRPRPTIPRHCMRLWFSHRRLTRWAGPPR